MRGLAKEDVEPCIRACALQLQLANIAEERERVRRRRHYDATGVRQRESLMEAADLLRDEGADLGAALRSLHVELVLTAHPTEATRRSVLDHQLHLAELLDGLDDPRIGRSRRRALRSQLREALTIWWQTDEVRRVRPMVEDEVRRNLFFFETTLHAAVPEVLEELERCFEVRVDGRELSFGSWAGSDMDGHPEVGAETLARTLTLHREAALRLLQAHVDRLAQSFSHSIHRVPVSAALEASLARDAAELPSARVLRRANREFEPLRTKLSFITRRLSNMLDPLAREPGLRRARRSCATTSGWSSRASARRTSRTAACAGSCGRSTCSASTWPASTCASRRRSCRTRSRRSCPAIATPARTSGCGCSRRGSPSSGAAWTGARPARPASCCACSTRSRWRARRTASARSP